MASFGSGYTEYKECKAAGVSQVDLAHVKGFCTTIEKYVLNLKQIEINTLL